MRLSNKMADMLVLKARQRRMPITVNLELLPVCNLDCKMCYVRSDWNEVKLQGGLKSVDEWLEFAKELLDAGILFLLLTGGEVFIYPEFKRLYTELYKMGFAIAINTNATMIDESAIEWLEQYPPRCVSVSLYGSNDTIYEQLCGKKGMFTRVDHAIRLLKKAGIVIELKTVLTPYNFEDLENCWNYAKENAVPYEATAYSFPPTRKCNKEQQIRFTPKEVVEQTFRKNRMMSSDDVFDEEIRKYLQKYLETKDVPGKEQYGFLCSATNSSCWITWQGVMTPCALLNHPMTYPFEQGFLAAWESLKKETDQILLSRKCSYCDKRQICTICPAGAYGETGDIGGTSEYHCEMTETFLREMYKYVEGIGEKSE